MVICPGCGADMHFDPDRQKLVCRYCDKALDPKEYHPPKVAEASEHEGYYTATVFSCPQCGAEVISTDDTVATFCSYCGTSVMLEGRAAEQKAPDMVIPFKVTRPACEEAYRKLLKRALFAPSDMKRDSTVEKFRGIYMPYWVYSLRSDNTLELNGKKTNREGDYMVTRSYMLRTPVKASVSGASFDAASGFEDNLSRSIAPYRPVESAVDFDPVYLSGFYADSGDVSSETYSQEAKDLAQEYVAGRIRSKFDYGSYGISGEDIRNAMTCEESAKPALFPVWFMSVRNRKQDRISYAVINGETGKAAAEIPIDFKKFLLGSLILAIPLFILLNVFMTLLPGQMTVGSGVLALISILILNGQANRLFTREMFLMDTGKKATGKINPEVMKNAKETEDKSPKTILKILKFLSKFGVWVGMFIVVMTVGAVFADDDPSTIFVLVLIGVYIVSAVCVSKLVGNAFDRKLGIIRPEKMYKAKFSDKFPKLVKPGIALALTVIVLAANPVADYWYYSTAGLSLLLTAWSFIDIIREQNLLTTRKLPQLNARGGDERA